MLRLMHTEWLKLRRSVIWLLVPASPVLAALSGWMSARLDGAAAWETLLSVMALLHGLLILPLLTGIYAALICRYEHAEGGWKLLLSLPVTRRSLYAVKLVTIMALLALTQILFFLAVVLVGVGMGYSAPIPWGMLLMSAGGGWLACWPLAALQLFVSVAFQSFAAPLAVNVILTLPNILVANSARYGPFYPWAQPLLAMVPKEAQKMGALLIPMDPLLFCIGGGFLVFLAAGWGYFRRKAV
ncbi:ABC transporter permease [Gorillibacterium sp. sgz5001074]|uniref:ABC transporter permease n=1 Tax=Gorillibacterium sp. sgz5001074 TaxID=3446695 RepID=UPI003F66EB26